MGLITLVGLVSKNGILIVEFANHLQEAGREKVQAVIEAAGDAPAADPDDDGGDGGRATSRSCSRPGPAPGARNSIGIMLVSGMVIGTVFTLFVVPAVYLAVARDRGAVAVGRDRGRGAGQGRPA